MIWLHNLLNKKINFYGESVSWGLIFTALAIYFFIKNSISGLTASSIIFVILIFKWGLLNTPYLFVWNFCYILIRKRFFKENNFVYLGDKVRIRKGICEESPDGIVCDENLMVDKEFESGWRADRISKAIKIFYKIEYCDGFERFTNSLSSEEDMQDIKRKLILFKLA